MNDVDFVLMFWAAYLRAFGHKPRLRWHLIDCSWKWSEQQARSRIEL